VSQDPGRTKNTGDGRFLPPSELAAILTAGSLEAHFQPIVSLKKKSVIGVEALARAWNPETGEKITPLRIFQWAAAENRSLEVDRLCRARALEGFAPLASLRHPPLLFLNFEAAVIHESTEGSETLARAVEAKGLSPGDVVIEINESEVDDAEELLRFVESHRNQGFLIALDDLGAGFSNLQRLATLKPEIVKVDRSIIAELDSRAGQKELFRSLVVLGRGLGALVLAEGVENEQEVAVCADLGTDLIQGFFFGVPAKADAIPFPRIESLLDSASTHQRGRAVVRLNERKADAGQNWTLLFGLIDAAERVAVDDFDALFRDLIVGIPKAECIFVIDPQGWQVSETVESPSLVGRQRSRLFSPATRGTDHSLKDYFYSLVEGGLPRYSTEPYLSMATGLPCWTLSAPFQDATGTTYILCLDLAIP
jgi:EAL domain-containing protein (putative c-di-GMP-specific phosphodiesterase class I)